MSVEAGLGLDSAMAKIAERMRGPLKEEILITLHEIRMGKTRATALRAMADRCQVDDLTTFITALIQSQQLGISLGQVLRVQAEQIRTIQRQRIEERAQKAPVKLLIPLLLCIFPAMFVVIIGPAVIRIYDALLALELGYAPVPGRARSVHESRLPRARLAPPRPYSVVSLVVVSPSPVVSVPSPSVVSVPTVVSLI